MMNTQRRRSSHGSQQGSLIRNLLTRDKDKLHEAVSKAIESLTSEKYKFAFSWIALRNSDSNFVRLAKKEPNGNQLVKALHIEVPEEDRDVTYKMMENIFGLDLDFKILGTTMLMVPIIRDNLPSHKIEDIQHLVIKQIFFGPVPFHQNIGHC